MWVRIYGGYQLLGELSSPWNGVRLLAASSTGIPVPAIFETSSRAVRGKSGTGAKLNKIDIQRALRRILIEGADSSVSYIDVNGEDSTFA
jgi:hypothetical protein